MLSGGLTKAAAGVALSMAHRSNYVSAEYSQPVLCHLIQIFFHVFEDKVELVVLANDFFQFHDVHVIQLSQRLTEYTHVARQSVQRSRSSTQQRQSTRT